MTTSQVASLFLALAAVLVLARLLGAAARAIGQPAVLGEILSGILVGPTLFHGAVSHLLFPVGVQPFLTALADLGLALFMFLTGAELEHAVVRAQGRAAVGVAAGSVLLPLGLGCLLATDLFQHHRVGSEAAFVLFLGAAMSVTAFPVLARILGDRGMQYTRIGGTALAAAALADVAAWLLLAAVVMVSGGPAQWRLLLLPVYLLVLIGAVRPLLRRLVTARRATVTGADPALLAVVLGGLMLSCWATEWMGLQFIFGAFLFGAVLPRGTSGQAPEAVLKGLGSIGVVFLLPVFFVIAGLKVNLSHLGGESLGELALILLTAVAGKALGAFAGARLQGLPTQEARTMATLMNARGLTELVILSVGLQLGVLDQSLYSLMVVMAVLTTFMTGPILRLVHPDARTEEELRPASEAEHADGLTAAGAGRTAPGA
ncbi:cation/H(+) antiporter [Streptacidiphilus sp. PB12-B1b]|uniref:cation:proton antiporter n=1 Tax=Streptacidiphilus sp. PB12-B1b TaxID=2705012 RepID=UPI0015FB9DC4|nr:cation:proton antiporter [Streptacidiphilus sp. PB12-B1b]QMU78174.1 cation/H(+) antiporter [Streptacidiphilus sp. PB12-B1b]